MTPDMRILVADDDETALARLTRLLGDVDNVEIIGLAREADRAAEMIDALKPDLAMLGADLPRRNGLLLARALMATPRVEVLFMTDADEGAPPPWPRHPGACLSKPVSAEMLADALDRARAGRRASAPPMAMDPTTPPAAGCLDAFWVPGSRGLTRVDVSTIDWIEAARDYVLLHTGARSHILRATMGSLERQLDARQVLRISRSAFVRPDRVADLVEQGSGRHVVILRSGQTVRVGPTYGEALERLRGLIAA
jgi:two-component system, LytTR family, response regulator